MNTAPGPSTYPCIIYCDGACSGNPGPGGWGAIVLDPTGHVEELGGHDPTTTNNRMELMAAIHGLQTVQTVRAKSIDLYTDSVYVIRGITEWIKGWRARGWQTSTGEPVANREIWEELDEVVQSLRSPVNWLYVRGHRGVPGNERVDAIAVAFSKERPVDLYCGPISNYPVDIRSFSRSTEGSGDLPSSSKNSKSPGKSKGAYYISYLDREFQKHKTWPECESRVKGRTGAKFKKVTSQDEEQEYRTKWGVRT